MFGLVWVELFTEYLAKYFNLTFFSEFPVYTMASSRTRAKTEHPLFGHPADLPASQLPTVGDALKLILKYKSEDDDGNIRFGNKNLAIKQAALDVSNLWMKAVSDRTKVPLVSQKLVEDRLRKIYDKGLGIVKNKKQKEFPGFKEDMGKLFDICSCTCLDISCKVAKCKLKKCDGFHLDCRCELKVPKREVMFLLDQRRSRLMKIEGVDPKVTALWNRTEEREAGELLQAVQYQEKQQQEDSAHQKAQQEFALLDVNENVEMCKSKEVEDEDYHPPENIKENSKQNRTKLPKTAEACDRYLVSDRAGAAIASGVLRDYGIINDADTSQVIGPRKLADERHKYRMERRDQVKNDREDITSLYFDGKKTATRVLKQNPKTGRWSPRLEVEDHYVLIVEPGSQYLSHVTPPSGHGRIIAQSIYNLLKEEDLLDQPISVIGADGTNSNVGAENGAIHYLEMMLGKPLHYLICQLHGNELPFRAVFYFYDGKNKGPQHWRGPVGTSIKDTVSSLPVVAFQPISSPDFPTLSSELVEDLSWDQKYLYRICLAVITGRLEDDLAAIEPGPPCVSRWNTLWSRICRVYVGSTKPSQELKRIVNMIIKFSSPMWFIIKCNPGVTEGPKNTFRSMQMLKSLNATEKKVAKKAVQRNAFFAHSDQLLLAMCADEDEAVRHKSVGLIRKLRERQQLENESDEEDSVSDDDDLSDVDEELLMYTDDDEEEEEYEEDGEDILLDRTIRRVHVPKLKWQAHSYHTMIDWKKELETEPPFTSKLTDEQLIQILEIPLEVPRWLNNTQAVERGIKALTEAATAVTGQVERDGYIKQRMHSRKLMPKFNTKKDFYANI